MALQINGSTSWDDFVKVYLRKFYINRPLLGRT